MSHVTGMVQSIWTGECILNELEWYRGLFVSIVSLDIMEIFYNIGNCIAISILQKRSAKDAHSRKLKIVAYATRARRVQCRTRYSLL